MVTGLEGLAACLLPRTPAEKLALAVEMRRCGLLNRYEFRKAIDGQPSFKLAMKLISLDFKEAVRAAVRRELKRRRRA